MRRDYFLCFFLFSIATSLMFVCFVPLYFTYDIIVFRDFSLFERLCSCFFALAVLLVIPALAAYKRKFWITAGLICYGLLAYIPGWIIPGMTNEIAGSEAKLGSVVWAFCLKSIYGMVNAPFASLSKLFGDKGALSLSKLIFPIAIIMYIVVQLFRFYREAYIRDKLSAQQDDPSIERGEPTRAAESDDREVLGTVVMAPNIKENSQPIKVENRKPQNNSETKAAIQTKSTQLLEDAKPKLDNESAIPLKAPEKKEDVILLGAPSNSSVIQLGPPSEVKVTTETAKEQPKPQPQIQQPKQPIQQKAQQPTVKQTPQAGNTSTMDKMFNDFISNYEKQTHKKISETERKQLYVKFIELYKQQNGGKR